ncbi:MAG: DUF5817 domain-containing protein, partial [Haloarculaceae archaeon]
MYAVVGCGECSALWIVEGDPERTECPRCGTSKKHEYRREFLTTEDEDHAREVRASMLASRQGESDAFAEVGSFAELDAELEAAGVDDETYLEGVGVDTGEVEAAADRAAGGSGSAGRSREETVRAALRELEAPSEAEVTSYAAEHGVSREWAERALEKLVRA